LFITYIVKLYIVLIIILKMPPKAMTPIKGDPNSKKIPPTKVIGNFFSPEMRTVCALLELNDIPYSAESIEIFSESGRKDYLGINPAE
jgi:hypothetical protein